MEGIACGSAATLMVVGWGNCRHALWYVCSQASMTCSACHTLLSPEHRFCTRCGQIVSGLDDGEESALLEMRDRLSAKLGRERSVGSQRRVLRGLILGLILILLVPVVCS